MTRFLNRLQPWGIFLLRAVLGITMAVHGWQKLAPGNSIGLRTFHAGIDHFSHYVGTLGLPPWLGIVSLFTELVGGFFLILGLLTRLSAFLVAINMLVALATVGIHQGFGIYSYIAELAAIAILLVLTGPGKLALDRRLGLS